MNNHGSKTLFLLSAAWMMVLPLVARGQNANPVGPIPEAQRQRCQLADFYQQGTTVGDCPS
jgi:hypothetical protein